MMPFERLQRLRGSRESSGPHRLIFMRAGGGSACGHLVFALSPWRLEVHSTSVEMTVDVVAFLSNGNGR